MNSTLQQVLKAKNVEELRKYGGFSSVKKLLESQLGLKLGVAGWASLISKLSILASSVAQNYDSLSVVCKENGVKASKSKVFKLIGFKITVSKQEELVAVIDNLLVVFNKKTLDPYSRFEEKKVRNFINSSRFEGITMSPANEKTSLESVLAKHRRC